MSLATPRGGHRPTSPAQAATSPAVTSPQVPINRSIEMYLIHEELARVHMAQRHEEAERTRLARRVVVARRARRKAEQAALRARVAVLAVG